MSTSSQSLSSRSVIEGTWKEVLKTTEAAPDRSFVDLGGSSLAANQLVALLSKRLGKSIPVIRVFEHPTLRQFTQYLLGGDSSVSSVSMQSPSVQASAPATSSEASDPDRDIAIIGMACRFPGANTLDEFWQNLVDGKDTITLLSKDELSAEVPAELREDPRYVRARGMIDRPYAMDAALFDIGPMEAKLIDPQQRILLEVAHEALENAAQVPGSVVGRAAVFAGIEDNTYFRNEILPFPEAEKRAGRFTVMTGNEKDFVAMRIAHKLDLKGPAVSVHTACSTSLVAVIMACKSLRHGECDLAVAGGASVHFPTHDGYYFQEGGVFSPDGHCRPFDKDAAGTIFTDGAGVVVLKRLKDAIRDRDTVYAVIKGGAINNDGGDKASFSAPSIAGQSSCIAEAHADAGVDPETIDFVEAHGTATPVGDPIEVEALRQAFRRKTDKRQFCGLGSVKSNIGHTTAAAGVASLIKMALALKHGTMPPTAHFKSPNPGLELESSPFYIVSRLTEWKRGQSPRRAGLSSFGIGGTNSHVILEEAPDVSQALEVAARPFEILPVSAKSAAQRDQLLESIGALSVDARDAAFTLQNGRVRHKARGARVRLYGAAPSADLVVKADKVLEDPKLVLMFPGQGSQYIEMGRSLYEAYPEFRATFDAASEALSRELGLDFKAFIFDPSNHETLENTKYTQPALFALEVSLGRMLLDWGLKPAGLIGHSIGEFAAAHLAGVFSLEDGIKLISARGRLMASLPRGKMLSVRGPLEQILAIAGAEVDLASVNSPIHCVLAGSFEAIASAQGRLEAQGLACRALHTSHAFHSSMMSPVVEPFLAIAREVSFSAPAIPIVSTVTGEPMTDAQATDPAYWANHLRATVRFSPALQKSIEQGNNLFLEIGPRTTLSSLALQHLKGMNGTAISTLGDSPDAAAELGSLGTALAKLWLSGLELPWNAIWTGAKRIPLVAYPYDRKDYRFSEGRKPEAKAPSLIEPLLLPEVNDDEGVPAQSGVDALQADLARIFSEHSGMTIENRDTTFVENGFDSLVLMQIGVELGKKYGVSVSLKDLMGSSNSLPLLAARIAKDAPEKLPAARVANPRQTQTLPRFAVPTEPMPASAAQIIHQQLTQMKEVLELQLRYLASVTEGGAIPQQPIPAVMPGLTTAAIAQKLEAKGLIRAKHQAPPTPDAFRAKAADGTEAWFRFDAAKNGFEILN